MYLISHSEFQERVSESVLYPNSSSSCHLVSYKRAFRRINHKRLFPSDSSLPSSSVFTFFPSRRWKGDEGFSFQFLKLDLQTWVRMHRQWRHPNLFNITPLPSVASIGRAVPALTWNSGSSILDKEPAVLSSPIRDKQILFTNNQSIPSADVPEPARLVAWYHAVCYQINARSDGRLPVVPASVK